MAFNPYHGVASFHINIDAGDGAIHIHYYHAVMFEEKLVKHAIFIDGGKGEDNDAKRNVYRTVEDIEATYWCQGPLKSTGRPLLQFDAFIVTHWDQDHCDGLMGFIKGDLDVQYANKAHLSPSDYRSNRAIYDPPQKGQPQSFFFAPHWISVQTTDDGAWHAKHSKDFQTDNPADNMKTPPPATGMSIRLGESIFWAKNQLKMRIGTDKILGRNFFNNNDLPSGFDPRAFKDLPTLVALNKPEPDGDLVTPGMYCVAVNRRVLGNGIVTQTTPKNKSSICAMIVWSNKRVSHYFAGDAHKELEEKIIEWTGFDGAGDERVTTVKLSHHGAETSSPDNLWDNFNPRSVIVSAGGGSYGHPRWEVLLKIDAWFRNKNHNDSAENIHVPLYLTQYPSFLYAKDNDFKYSRISDAGTDMTDEESAFSVVNYYIARSNQLREKAKLARLSNFIDDYKKRISSIPTPTKKDKLRAVFEYLVESLVSYCPNLPNLSKNQNTPGRPTAKVGDAYLLQSRTVEYVMVESHSLYEHEGGVWMKYEGVDQPDSHTAATLYPWEQLPCDLDDFRLSSSTELALQPTYGMEEGAVTSATYQSMSPSDDLQETLQDWVEVLYPSTYGHQLVQTSMCYIASADRANLPTRPSVITVAPPHPLYGILNGLIWKLFITAGVPNAGQEVEFADNDDWRNWFRIALGDPSLHMRFKPSVWPLDAQLPAFSNVFSTSLKLGKNDFTYDTSHAAGALNVRPSGLEDLVRKERTLVFGLSRSGLPTKSESMTLADLAKQISFPYKTILAILGPMVLTPDVQKGTRNAIWFTSERNYETIFRQQFTASHDLLDSWLKDKFKDFEITSLKVIAKTTCMNMMNATSSAAAREGDVSFVITCNVYGTEFGATLQFRSQAIIFRLQKDQSNDWDALLASLIKWLGSTFDLGSLSDIELWLGKAKSILEAVKPRVLEVQLDFDDTGKLKSLLRFNICLQATMNIGNPQPGTGRPLVFFLVFGWSKARGFSLDGNLWCNDTENSKTVDVKTLSSWESHLRLKPDLGDPSKAPVENLDLKALLNLQNFPDGIPSIVEEASISIDQTGISFKGALMCTDSKSPSKVPKLFLDRLGLSAGFKWGKRSEFSFDLEADFLLFPRDEVDDDKDAADQDPARFLGHISYSGGAWSLLADLRDLRVEHLATFFDPDIKDGVLGMIGGLTINTVTLQYDYEAKSTGAAKKFSLKGIMTLGKLQLDLDYWNTGNDWSFSAKLGADNKASDTSIGEILKSFLGDTPDIPNVILDIPVGKPGSGDELLRFECTQIEANPAVFNQVEDDKLKLIKFVASIHLKNVTFSFIQYRNKKWDSKRKSKQIIKVLIDGIGEVEAPLVGKLKSPFDQLFYVWVKHDPQYPEQSGVTYEEYQTLSPTLKERDKLYYKSTKPKPEKEDIVIAAGPHFIVVTKDSLGAQQVILDYVFVKPKATPKILEYDLCLDGDDFDEAFPFDEKPGAPPDPSKAPLKKSIGPISIENISLQYKDGRLAIFLDATFFVGPIGLALLGFGISFAFEKQQKDQKDLIEQQGITDVRPMLSGLLASFDRPPLTVAGGFKHTSMERMECYAGGLIVGFKPWMLTAVGVYSEVNKKAPRGIIHSQDNDKYTSLFIFVRLEGPLFSFGFADISGLTGGLGVNSGLKLPTVENVVEFPFVKSDSISKDESPLKTLQNLLGGTWFSPEEGSFWVAVGLKATAFQMVTLRAVVVVQLNPDLFLGIYGVAVLDVPTPDSAVKFVHVELGILCTLDLQVGVFKLEAQLSPNSYVLHPSCHVTGGFALYSWFKEGPDAVAGDWVATLGGYHQAFLVPKQYPRPPRLGISWSLGKISITGEAYFAVTPKVCMGGGRIHAALSAGPLLAYFDAYLDFLINYQPFHFEAEGRIAVGVQFSMDLWIVTVHISVEIAATLKVGGPPMVGTVHVDFWVFGFDIDFGDKGDGKPPRLLLSEFYDFVLKSNTATGLGLSFLPIRQNASEDTPTEQDTKKHFLFNCKEGLIPENEENPRPKSGMQDGAHQTLDNSKRWLVRGGLFSFMLTFKFPVSDGTFKYNIPSDHRIQTIDVAKEYKEFFARPMELTQPLTTPVTVEVSQTLEQRVLLREISPEIDALKCEEDLDWRITSEVKSVQSALWGQYNSGEDPSVGGNKLDSLLDGGKRGSVPLVMGLTFTPPPPDLACDAIPKFNIVEDIKQSVFDGKTRPIPQFPDHKDASTTWNPRAATSSYEDVQAAWKVRDGHTEDPAAIWAEVLGFDREKMSGKRPAALTSRLKQMVPAVPMIAIGVTA